MTIDEEEKEKRLKKQTKRMEKILARAWQLDESASFQDLSSSKGNKHNAILCLTAIGQKLDQHGYRLGRHGWEEFAQDLGGVYNRHIQRRTKKAESAKQHLETVKELLGARDKSLIEIAAKHVPVEHGPANEAAGGSSTPNKRRRSSSTNQHDHESEMTSPKKKSKHSSQNKELAEREDRAMEQLATFLEERGATHVQSLLDGFTARVTKKRGGGNKYDTNYFNANRRRFRSMLEVGRFFKLVNDGGKGTVGGASLTAASKVQRRISAHALSEKNRLRKEMERLRKAHQRASKALDDYDAEKQGNASQPIDEEEEHSESDRHLPASAAQSTKVITRSNCASARLPDINGFPGVPTHCVPDVLMSWDFLCTFERALSLTPIALDDFASALAYQPPPQGSMTGDDITSPPVYLAEAHLGLLKMLLQDAYSDDWWWSVLETEETESDGAIAAETDAVTDELLREGKPVIQIDVVSLLNQHEDPLITLSWVKALDKVGTSIVKEDAVKQAIRTALKVCANKWAHAYLRTALNTKGSGKTFMLQAVLFLVNLVRKARPDLMDRAAKPDDVAKAKDIAIEEASQLMRQIASSAPTVTSDDAVSDFEYDEDEDESDAESDEEDEDRKLPANKSEDTSSRHASVIPPRPPPSYTDMLLPPTKPHHNSEYVNPFTWPHILGATVHRILHRKKRLLNETDDNMRSSREIPPLTVTERREREEMVASRVLTECSDHQGDRSPAEEAIEHLCSGGDYLQLSTTQRLCLLRLLIEAAYDSSRLYSVVDGNIKQRTNATKALEVEQRRAKREAKEKAAADEAAAREQLALEARERFFDEKRDEIRKLNEKNKEITDDILESLTEEDILDFDEDFKADFEALPKPESFSKNEVKKMVSRIQEENAFDTDALRVLTLEELQDLEQRELEGMEGELQGMGGEDALNDTSLDRETLRSIERLQRDINKAKDQAEKLPELRERALDQLRDAMADGTIKVLRTAITAAKKARLSGPDDETGGLWAVDLLRDAALELENAKQNKRVLDAQRDLVAKMNKCFIRSEPIGYDRFGNRFWQLDQDEEGHVWVEAECVVASGDTPEAAPAPGFVNLVREASAVACGAPDMEVDLLDKTEGNPDDFRTFSRQEYHSEGFTPTLAKNLWGCLATEESMRSVIRILDSKRARENELKKLLKESVEQTVAANEDKLETIKEERQGTAEDDPALENADTAEADLWTLRDAGDELVFKAILEDTKESRQRSEGAVGDDSSLEYAEPLATAIGAKVRVRHLFDPSKDNPLVRYECGVVVGWKYRREENSQNGSVFKDHQVDDDDMTGAKFAASTLPVWKISSDRGHTFWLSGPDLVESLGRYVKWSSGKGYLESDAAYISYRNALGRHCGRAAEAAFASSPIAFARFMVKREAELYAKLKIRSYDNTWGGKSGARALWTNSMKDYAFDFPTAKQGLLTLENAFFELTGQFDDYPNNINGAEPPDLSPEPIQKLLHDPKARVDLELETIEKVPGLWNSPLSRAVFVQLVQDSNTTGFLALALDQLCRNTTKYLHTHKLLKSGNSNSNSSNHYMDDGIGGGSSGLYEEEVLATTQRRTRGMNAWQRKQVSYEEFF